MFFLYSNYDQAEAYRDRVKQGYQAAQYNWQVVTSPLARLTRKACGLIQLIFLFSV